MRTFVSYNNHIYHKIFILWHIKLSNKSRKLRIFKISWFLPSFGVSQQNPHNYLKKRWNFVKIGMVTRNRYKLKVRKSEVAYPYRFLDILESFGGGAKLPHSGWNTVKKAETHLSRRALNDFIWQRAFSNANVNEKICIFNKSVLNVLIIFIPYETMLCDDKDPPWFNSRIMSFSQSF